MTEHNIGQVVSYMRHNELKYGFLSTYNTTVFVKRVADYRFELSQPIDKYASNPSLRECFVAFCVIASGDAEYVELVDVDELRVSSRR